MTFRQIIAQYSPVDSKNKLNSLLAAVERNFGVFSPDMELDIRSIIKDNDVEEYFDRIIHEDHPKLEYDKKTDMLRGRKIKNVDTSKLWSKANGIYEQLYVPTDIVDKAGHYNCNPSKRTDNLKRIFKIDAPDLNFFKWGLPANSHTGWAIAVYLTNPTRLRRKRLNEYQDFLYAEREMEIMNKKKAKKEKLDGDNFSFINSNLNSWGSYNLIDD